MPISYEVQRDKHYRLEREKFSLETELKTSSKRATTVEELASPPKPSQKANVERPSSALRENLRILQEQNRRLTEEVCKRKIDELINR